MRTGSRPGFGKRLTGMLTPIKLWREYRSGDFRTRTRITALFSMLGNFALAAGKAVIGIFTLSVFMLVSAFYSVFSGLAKQFYYRGAAAGREDAKKEVGYYFCMAVFLLVASLVYSLYMVRLFFLSEGLVYGTIAGITVAAVSFTELFMAVKGLVKSNRLKDMLVSGLKTVNLSGALTAIVLTQTALLSFTSGAEAAYSGATAVFGLCVGLVSSGLAVSMLFKARRVRREGGASDGKRR